MSSESHFWELALGGPLQGQVLNLNTLMMLYAAMGVVLLSGFLLTRRLSVVPTRQQALAERVYGFCRSLTLATSGPRGDQFLPYVGAIFLFVFTANVMGQLPLRLISLPHGELRAATEDFNVAAALAVGTVLSYFYYGIKQNGLGYFSHYLNPLPTMVKGQPWFAKVLFVGAFWPFIFLNVLEDFTRPGSLMIRLFFNILIGEILAGIAMSVQPLVLPAFVIFLELFVAFIQAYVFAIISSVYISLMSEDHSHHQDEEGHAH
jgi:F-type H+-transporting ATPase subunit a